MKSSTEEETNIIKNNFFSKSYLSKIQTIEKMEYNLKMSETYGNPKQVERVKEMLLKMYKTL